MASVTATGIFGGKRVAVTWSEPGVLSSESPGMREVVRLAILNLEGVYVGPPTGGGRVTDQMSWPAPFMQVTRELLTGCRFSGDLLVSTEVEEPDDTDIIE